MGPRRPQQYLGAYRRKVLKLVHIEMDVVIKVATAGHRAQQTRGLRKETTWLICRVVFLLVRFLTLVYALC